MTLASTPTAPLLVRQGMSFRDWVTVGKRLASVSSASTWALGDWLVFGERTFGHRYRAALEVTNLDYQTLRNYAWVAGRFPPSRRRAGLSFQHHAELAAMPEVEQDIWLQRAINGCWSRNELRRRVKAHRQGLAEIPGAAPVVVRVELSAEDERRWKAAANDMPLMEWLRTVANAAAAEALAVSP
jgi:hypothetical protein